MAAMVDEDNGSSATRAGASKQHASVDSSQLEPSLLAVKHQYADGQEEESNDATALDKTHKDSASLLLVEVYNSLTSVSRPLLLKMNERFIKDPLFRGIVKNYIEPAPTRSHAPKPSFPFMKLPTELRIRVAEYALANIDGLMWNWKQVGPKKWVGYFCPTSINSLGLVSRQLYLETKGIAYKVNTLHFDDDFMDNPFPFDQSFDASVHTYHRFQKDYSPSVFAAVRSIRIYACCHKDDKKTLERFIKIAQEMPTVTFGLTDKDFEIRYDPNPFSTRTDITEFMDYGRTYQRLLSEAPYNSSGRTWRVFPDVCPGIFFEEKMERLRMHLAPSDFELALDWIENGI